MAENKNDFNETVASLFKGMDSFYQLRQLLGKRYTLMIQLYFH